jgi:hypothetical protein
MYIQLSSMPSNISALNSRRPLIIHLIRSHIRSLLHSFLHCFFFHSHLGTLECAAFVCPVVAAPLPQVQSWPLMRRPPEVTSSTAAVCAAPQLTEDTYDTAQRTKINEKKWEDNMCFFFVNANSQDSMCAH